MKVELTQDTRVNFPAGTVVEVSEAEAKRLTAFGVAVVVAEKKPVKKGK